MVGKKWIKLRRGRWKQRWKRLQTCNRSFSENERRLLRWGVHIGQKDNEDFEILDPEKMIQFIHDKMNLRTESKITFQD